jgi:hypothetical protein
MDTTAGKKSSFSHRVNLIALLKAIDPLIEVYDWGAEWKVDAYGAGTVYKCSYRMIISMVMMEHPCYGRKHHGEGRKDCLIGKY